MIRQKVPQILMELLSTNVHTQHMGRHQKSIAEITKDPFAHWKMENSRLKVHFELQRKNTQQCFHTL